jgi:hypothetical protein
LRAGDVVEVRSAAEILATLDERGQLEALDFMPEMMQFCGRRFTVLKRAEKVCDMIHFTGSRRVPRVVILDDARCDGKTHGGCEAECRLFWKEEWLRPAGSASKASPAEDEQARAKLAELLARNTKRVTCSERGEEEVWRCQATGLHDASDQINVLDPRAYVGELTSGNVSIGRFIRVTARAAIEEPLGKLGLLPAVALAGTRDPAAPPEPALGLSRGDWVQVKSKEEIARTLTARGKNRGLWFDREMLPYCGDGKKYQVRRRVNRIVDERTGRMNELKNDCIALEGVVCSGDFVPGRFFCPRGHFPYWRECWLTRAEAPDSSASGQDRSVAQNMVLEGKVVDVPEPVGGRSR